MEKPPPKLSELIERFDGLSPETRSRLSELLADLNGGPMGDAYRDLAEMVGHDAALSHLTDALLGTITLDDGTEIARSAISKSGSDKLQ